MFKKIYKNKIKSVRSLNDNEFQISYDNGDSYLGEFNDLTKMITGEGHYVSKEYTYRGNFKYNRMDGRGILKKNGNTYDCLFSKDEIVNGLCIYANGAKYEGEFKNEEKHGYGTYSAKNDYYKKYIYEGEWLGDLKHGKGKETLKKLFYKKDHIPVKLYQSKATSRYFFQAPTSKKIEINYYGEEKISFVDTTRKNNWPILNDSSITTFILPIELNEKSREDVIEEFGEKALLNYKTGELELFYDDDFPLTGEMSIVREGIYKNGNIIKGTEKVMNNEDIKWTYQGNFLNGMWHGNSGKIDFYNGDTFSGSLDNGKYKEGLYRGSDFSYDGIMNESHLRGILKKDNMKISGDFPTGLAKVENDEYVYKGDLVDGKKHGHGKIKVKKTGKIVSGSWINDEFIKE